MHHYSEDPSKQYHIKVGADDVGRYCILPGDPGRVEKIAKYFDDAAFVSSNREYTVWTGYLEGEKVSAVSTGIGGPSTAICVEELVKCGAHTFVRTGTCGGMQEKVLSGDIVIASGSIRAEGTSREYAPIEFPAVADFDVLTAMVKAASDLKLPYHVGVSQSKDSFYGQHSPEESAVSYELVNKWNSWLKLGCLASEMEAAALFIVAANLGVRSGACFLVAANQEREKKGLPNPVVRDVDGAVRVAGETVRNLILADRVRNRKEA